MLRTYLLLRSCSSMRTTKKVFIRSSCSDNSVQVSNSMHSNVQLLYLLLVFTVGVGVGVAVVVAKQQSATSAWYRLCCCFEIQLVSIRFYLHFIIFFDIFSFVKEWKTASFGFAHRLNFNTHCNEVDVRLLLSSRDQPQMFHSQLFLNFWTTELFINKRYTKNYRNYFYLSAKHSCPHQSLFNFNLPR